jgi:hypothetical protein
LPDAQGSEFESLVTVATKVPPSRVLPAHRFTARPRRSWTALSTATKSAWTWRWRR